MSDAAAPELTIAVVPREQFGVARSSLESIYAHTDGPFELVYVDGASPEPLCSWLREQSKARGFRLLRSEHFLSPNQARNWALQHARGRYVVFVDNDLIVSSGWLSAMQRCAEETGAWAVGPLYLEGDPDDDLIHMAGGSFELGDAPSRRSFHTEHLLQGQHLRDQPAPLARSACDFVEFHCMLVRREVFDTLGPLDEELLNTREHLDLCLQIREHGGQVFFEPDAHVTYKSPPPLAHGDHRYFLTRWSEEWTRRSLEHFIDKWGLDQRYLERAHIARNRRGVTFVPFAEATGRVLGRWAEHALSGIVRRLEPPLNRALVRDGPLALDEPHSSGTGGHVD